MTPEEVELLSELTIVIPTYNRPLELERAIEYWRDIPVTVHILDGSEKPWFPVGVLPSASKITYHHFPSQNSSGPLENYLLRIKFGTELSKTKYSALCADDDVFLFNGLVDAIKVLESNDSLDSVIGQNSRYLKVHPDVLWFERGIVIHDSERCNLEVSRRLLCVPEIANYYSNYYGIFKTQVWIQIFQTQASCKFKFPISCEFLVHLLISILSRNFIIDSQLWVTNKATPGGTNLRQIGFGDWLNGRESRGEVKEFISILSKSMSAIDPSLSIDNADKLIRLRLSLIKPNRQTFGQSFVLKTKKVILVCISHLPKAVRFRLFRCLSDQLQNRIGNDDFKIKSKSRNFLSDELVNSTDFQKWEKILLMQREELRLRANI